MLSHSLAPASRRINENSTSDLNLQTENPERKDKMYNSPFVMFSKQNITPARDDLSKSRRGVKTRRKSLGDKELGLQGDVKGEDYISDARFDSVESVLHGCDDFRKSSRASNRINKNSVREKYLEGGRGGE